MRGNRWLSLLFMSWLCVVPSLQADFARCDSQEHDLVTLVRGASGMNPISPRASYEQRRVRFVNDLEQFDDDGSLALIEKACKVNEHELRSGEEKELYVDGDRCSITIGLLPGIANAFSGGGSFFTRLLNGLERLFRKRWFTFICYVPDRDEVNIASSFITAVATAETVGYGALSYRVRPTLELEVSLVPTIEM